MSQVLAIMSQTRLLFELCFLSHSHPWRILNLGCRLEFQPVAESERLRTGRKGYASLETGLNGEGRIKRLEFSHAELFLHVIVPKRKINAYEKENKTRELVSR